MAKLTPKQQRFVDEYLIDLNATQAAIRAGYSPKTAEQQFLSRLCGGECKTDNAKAQIVEHSQVTDSVYVQFDNGPPQIIT